VQIKAVLLPNRYVDFRRAGASGDIAGKVDTDTLDVHRGTIDRRMS
jgi:hypothetical protein